MRGNKNMKNYMYQTVKDMILLRLKNKFIHWFFLIAIRRMFINGKHGSLGFIDKQESRLWGSWDSWGGMEMAVGIRKGELVLRGMRDGQYGWMAVHGTWPGCMTEHWGDSAVWRRQWGDERDKGLESWAETSACGGMGSMLECGLYLRGMGCHWKLGQGQIHISKR